MQDVETLWRSQFAETPPRGHMLRRDFPDRWLRLHSLPASKRYADTDKERATIILRANTIGEEIFGEGATIYLMSTRPKTQFSISIYSFRTLLNLYRFRSITRQTFKLKHAFTSKDLLEEEDCLVQNFTKARKLSWKAKAFNVTFQKIADDEEYGVIFVASDFKSILAPYDGGFDLILPDSDHVKKLKETYKDWLSNHPAGL